MKVILWMACSVNGIIATDDNKEDFLSHENWEEFVSSLKVAGALIWGRKTYENVQTWDSSYHDSLKDITKVIVSRNKSLHLNNGYILANSPKQAIQILEEKGFDKVILSGGAINNTSFLDLNLINELLIDIEPILIGKGISLFIPKELNVKLELLDLKKISNDIIQLHYKVV